MYNANFHRNSFVLAILSFIVFSVLVFYIPIHPIFLVPLKLFFGFIIGNTIGYTIGASVFNQIDRDNSYKTIRKLNKEFGVENHQEEKIAPIPNLRLGFLSLILFVFITSATAIFH